MTRSALALVAAVWLVTASITGAAVIGLSAADTTTAPPPSGMVGVPGDQIEDIRADSVSTELSAGDLEGAVYVSDHGETTEVSIATREQSDQVAAGANPSDVAGDAVCGSPASGQNPVIDCDQGTPFTLIISDNSVDDGRTVAVDTEVLEDVLGYVPSRLTVRNNETGERWTSQATVEDGWLVTDVKHFSSNTVTWTGEVSVSGSPASDGSTFQYDLSDLDSATDPVVNLTGVTNSEYDNVSASGVGVDHSTSLSVGGNVEPTDGAGGDPIISVTASPAVEYNPVTAEGDGDASSSDTFVGDSSADNAYKSEVKVRPTSDMNVSEVTVGISNVFGDGYQMDVDVYIVQESSPDQTYGEGTLVKGNWNPSFSTGAQTITLDSAYQMTADTNYSVEFVTQNVEADGSDDYLEIGVDTSASSTWRTISPPGYDQAQYANLTLKEPNTVSDLSVTDGDGHSYSFGDIPAGESKQGALNLQTSATSLSFSGTGSGTFDYTLQMQERTQTVDPGVELNGNWLNHSGTLADGNTVSLTGNSTWLQEGTNRLNVSVGDGSLSADAPAAQVELVMTHDASSNQTVDYTDEAWTSRYEVNKTYASDQAGADLTIPFGDTVVAVRDIEISRDGSSWSALADSDYSLSNTTLTADIGSVSANETVAIRANASKVQVENLDLQVTDPSLPGDRLDTQFDVLSTSGTPRIHYDSSSNGDRIHYTYNESWTASEYAVYDTGGNRLVLPNAGAGSTARVSTIPVTVSPQTGDVEIRVSDPQSTEPVFSVSPGSNTDQDVEYTYVGAKADTKYILYSVSDDVVRDSGTASSPLTLLDDDSSETLQFLIDSEASVTDPPDDDGPGGVGPTGSTSTGLLGGLLGNGLLVLGLGGVLVVGVVYWRGGTDSVASTASKTAGKSASLVSRTAQYFASHPYVAAFVSGVGAVGLVATGVVSLPAGGGVFLLVVGTPAVAYVVLVQRLGASRLVWGILTAASVILGFQLLGTDVFGTLAGSQAFPILAIGAVGLAYYALKTYRSEATTPDEKNVIQFNSDDDGGDGR